MKKVILAGIAGIIAMNSYGQFTLSGEYRPRGEYRHGFQSVADENQESAFFIDQRTRLNLDYKVSDYEFYLSVQDIRTWGSTSQLNTTDGFMSVHQAWGKVNLTNNFGLKLGRQEIAYDDHRIFGNVGWAQQARSHDAAILQFQKNKTKLDVGLAFNQAAPSSINVDYNLAKSYRDMHYAMFNHKVSEKVTLGLLALNLGQQVDVVDANGDPHKSMQYTQTFGTHTKFDFGKLKMNLNGYYQMGSAPVSPAKDLSAYLFGLEGNYNLTKEFSVGLGYETQSGTSQTDTTSAYTDVVRNFSPYFGTNHKFNGFMDYFYVGNSHGNVGLQDAYLKLKYKKDKWAVGADLHMFMTGLVVEVLDTLSYSKEYTDLVNEGKVTEANDLNVYDYSRASNLGTELDLSFMYKIKPAVTLKMGYSQMFASETLAFLKGVLHTEGDNAGRGRTDQINNWGYVMVIIKPTFFSSAKEKK